MRGRSLSILGILAAIVGAILILCFKAIKVSGVEITCGVLFVGVGMVNLLFFSAISKNENAVGRVLTLVTNAASIVLGICMLVFQSTFLPLVTFMFGLLLAVCSLWQFFVLALGTRPYQLPAWLYIFPVLLAGASVFVFLRNPSEGEDHILMLATGIAMALLGLGCVLEGSLLGMARHSAQRNTSKTEVQIDPLMSTPEEPVKKKVETTDDLDDEVM